MLSIDPFLNLITSEHRSRPNFIAWVGVLLQGLVDAANTAESLQTLFDLDNAVGDQLDKVGQWIGPTRYITEPLAITYFSWDVPGAGWEQADWYHADPFVLPPAQIVRLDDAHYRTLLRAAVAANNWDGTIPGAYAAWETAFGSSGFQILIQNVGSKTVPWFSWGQPTAGWGHAAWYTGVPAAASDNMHIILALVGPPIDALTKALFTGGYLDLKGAGVMVDAYAVQPLPGVPLFAWGCGPRSPTPPPTCPPVNLAGWGMGAWADMTIKGA
jgi:hypothetical protein